MMNIGSGEVLVILLVALIVLGPTKLPEAAKQVGKAMTEFRRLSSGFQRELKEAMDDVTVETEARERGRAYVANDPPKPVDKPKTDDTPAASTASPSSTTDPPAEAEDPTAEPSRATDPTTQPAEPSRATDPTTQPAEASERTAEPSESSDPASP